MPKYDFSQQSALDSLQARNARYWQGIAVGRSLGIYVSPQGVQLWKARYRSTSGLYKETTLGLASGVDDALSFDQAIAAAEAWFSSDPVRSNAVSRHAVRYNGELTICPCGDEFTVGHALRDYIEWKRMAAAQSHFETVVTLINHHLVPRVANLALAKFTAKDFHKLCLSVLETPPKYGNRKLGPKRPLADLDPEALRRRKKTMNTLVSILRGAFGLAWENCEIDSDRPVRCLKHLPNFDRPRSVFLSRPECAELVEASRPDLRQLILGALYTGCRVRELTNLRVRDVAQEGYGIYIAPSKTYRPRFVFLPDEGMAFFLSACREKKPDELVFLNADGRQWSDRYKHLFRDLIDRKGLPRDTVFHSLRHTYASQLVQAGASLAVVAKQLGHADTATVDRIYGHLAPDQTEAELTLRFAPLNSTYVLEATTADIELVEIKARFRGKNHRLYSKVEAPSSWPRSNFSRFSGDMLAQLPHYGE
ncbi:site-specific integrase [Mesorhizobium sp. WSM2239]|uniref:Site-specific integrase n=2 Tax=unclassified Mesorhizobium TaxID=325217 RepID=A0AAU8DHI4_9HYPH